MISVIIVNWNGLKFLQECLDALAKQSFRDFEIILVDNNSSDGSIEWVKKEYPAVKIIALPENRGFAAANNEGIRQSKGDIIALLNNDARPDVNWLAEMDSALKNCPNFSFAASKILFAEAPEFIDSAGDEFSTWGVGYQRGHEQEDEPRFNEQTNVFSACGCAAVYRRQMLEDIGGFDEDFFAYYEDIDLSWRAWRKGYCCLYVPTAVVYHHGQAATMNDPDKYVYLVQRNQELVLMKSVSGDVLMVCLPFHMVFIIASFFKSLYNGQARVFLHAKRDALKMLPKMLKKRKEMFK